MSGTENGVSWLHRFGSLVAVMTFLLLMTGMLASSTVPNFPAALWKGPPAVGFPPAEFPGKYANVFQTLAVAVALLTLTFALLLWKSRSHRYLKILSGVTVGVLLSLALVLLSPMPQRFPETASFAYTFGIQVFFCLAVCLALFTRTDWRWDEPKAPDLASPSIRQILVFTTTAVFVQSLLGEGFRKREIGISPHLVIGIAVTVCSLWVLEMALTKFAHLRAFKISAVFLAQVVVLQLFLGIITYSMNLNARAVPGSQPGVAVMNVTHAAVGALLLATSLFVTCQGFKYFAPAEGAAASPMPRDLL